jgi:predicted permease
MRAIRRIALRLVPSRWRESVARDLAEDGARAGRTGARRDAWIAWHALRIAARMHGRRLAAAARGATGILPRPAADLRALTASLRHQPLGAAAVALTLALGIGAATAVYAVFNHALFRPVPGVSDPATLVSVYFQPDRATPSRIGVAWPRLAALRDAMTTLDGLAGWGAGTASLRTTPDAAAESREVITVTRGYFGLLDVRFAAGRDFTRDEYDEPGRRVAIVSRRLWERDLQRDSSVVGRTIWITGLPFQIAGVVDEFRGLALLDDQDIWTPAASWLPGDPMSRDSFQSMVGRLRPGATAEAAHAEAVAIFDAQGEIGRGDLTFRPAVFAGLSDGIGQTRARLAGAFRVVMASSALLLLVACLNAANLMMVRNARRRGELAVRSALGASRARLLRELLVEALGIASLAAALGLGVAILLARLFQGVRLISYRPPLDDLVPDWQVALFCASIAGATVLIFAFAPAWSAARVEPQRELRRRGRTTPSAARVRHLLVGAQLAFSVALGVTAGLLGQTVHRLHAQDLGIDMSNLVIATLIPRNYGYDDDAMTATFVEVLDRLQTAPGVDAAAMTFFAPFGSAFGERVRPDGAPLDAERQVTKYYVTAGYFETMRLDTIAGRTFRPDEADPARQNPAVVVVNASLARALYGGSPNTALGRGVTVGNRASRRFEIVGVVEDAIGADPRDGREPAAYFPFDRGLRVASFVVRTPLAPGIAEPIVRGIVREVAPSVPVEEFASVEEAFGAAIAEERLLSMLSRLVAAIAWMLAMAGVYSVTSSLMQARRRDLGIRLALGATPAGLGRHVVGGALPTAVAGIAAGLAIVWLGRGYVESRLFGVAALEPVTLAVVSGLSLLLVVIAAWLPARRASRVDPVTVLRTD